MNEPTPPIPGIRQQYVHVDDADQSTLVSSVAVNLAYAELWVVARSGQARLIGRSAPNVIGKIDSAGSRYYPDGTARLWCSAAHVGGSGTTSRTVYFDFPNALGALDAHGKDLIYERVTNPTSGTHQAIQSMIDAG